MSLTDAVNDQLIGYGNFFKGLAYERQQLYAIIIYLMLQRETKEFIITEKEMKEFAGKYQVLQTPDYVAKELKVSLVEDDGLAKES